MTMFSKLAKFARSPQGKKLADKAMQAAKDPKTKAKIEEQRAKLAKKDQPAGGTTPPPREPPPAG
jgi:hypothetical protein